MTALSLSVPRTVMSHPDGDQPHIDARFIVAPSAGIFRPAPVTTYTTEGEIIDRDGIVGHIDGPGRTEPVTSFCSGFLVRLFVDEGQRVRPGQRIAWLHPIDRPDTRPERTLPA